MKFLLRIINKQAGAELCQAQLKLKFEVIVKALSLIFENGNVEVWSQRGFKLKKLLDENIEVEEVLDGEVWSWSLGLCFPFWAL